jgi:NADH dehydrogenase/putative oxidoreductase
VSRLAGFLGLAHKVQNFLGGVMEPLLLLALRVWLAKTFFWSGVLKVTDWETAVFLSEVEYPVTWLDPAIATYLGVIVELGASALLIIGLFSRFAAAALTALALIIFYEYQPLAVHAFQAVLFGWIALRGPGTLSLDHLVGRAVAHTAVPFAASFEVCFKALTRWAEPLFLVFLRYWVGWIFFASGLTKIADWETTIFLFEMEYQTPFFSPEVNAILTTGAELIAPPLLWLGLGARFAALPLLFMTFVIQYTYLDHVQHQYWLLALLIFVLRGAGLFSADALITRWLRRKVPEFIGQPAFSFGDLPRVVIVGAGFGGMAAAMALKMVKCKVTVIDRRNYHLFQPLLYQVATASLAPNAVAAPIRSLLRSQSNTTVLMGRVSEIDTARGEVVMGDVRRVPYDYLVLATGARHAYFGRDDEWEHLAPGLKKIDDATEIRRRILSAFEAAETTADPDERRRWLTFVVVGAGPTGVELAGAIKELARFGMERDFRECDPSDARVILVQSNERVLPNFPEALSVKARAALEALGVEVRTKSRVEEIDPDGVIVSGERIEGRTVIWAAGVIASPAARWLGAEHDQAGRIKVSADLSVPSHPNVFAIGDTAHCEDSAGRVVPGLAPAAKQGGIYVARQIKARIAGKRPLGAFRYQDMGIMATIGRKAAIADLRVIRVSGLLAWWLWGFIHVALLTGMRNRLNVLVDWTWFYLTYRGGFRLITGTGPEKN